MTMITNRNQIPANVMALDTDMLDEIDAVYEIANAEFTSDKATYDRTQAIIKAHNKPQDALAQYFLGKVKDIAKREGFMAGVPADNFESVAVRLAKDWDATMGADYRREQEKESSGPGL